MWSRKVVTNSVRNCIFDLVKTLVDVTLTLINNCSRSTDCSRYSHSIDDDGRKLNVYPAVVIVDDDDDELLADRVSELNLTSVHDLQQGVVVLLTSAIHSVCTEMH